MSIVRLSAACIATALLSACSTLVPPRYAADDATLDQLKAQAIERVAVAPFQPRNPDAPVNKISLRAANLVGPKGSFAQYLEDALVQDLQAVRAYDPGARTRIDATLLRNEIDVSGVATGNGRMDVELVVTREAKTVLKKLYSTNASFESSFAGGVAMSKGQSEYGNLVRTLLEIVYADPQFITALGGTYRPRLASRGTTVGSPSSPGGFQGRSANQSELSGDESPQVSVPTPWPLPKFAVPTNPARPSTAAPQRQGAQHSYCVQVSYSRNDVPSRNTLHATFRNNCPIAVKLGWSEVTSSNQQLGGGGVELKVGGTYNTIVLNKQAVGVKYIACSMSSSGYNTSPNIPEWYCAPD